MTMSLGRSSVSAICRTIAFGSLLIVGMVLSSVHAFASLHEAPRSWELDASGSRQLAEVHDVGVNFSNPDVDYVRQLLQDPAAPQIGNPAGDVTVYEFFDYHCPYCKRVASDIMKLVKEDSGVRVVFKEFPILSEDSVTAAKAALAADKQGKYAAMHEALMKHRGEFTSNALARLAEHAGVDAKMMFADMSSPDISAQILRNKDLATALGIRGTPGFIFGSFLVPGAISYADMRKLIDEARRGG